MTQPLPDTGPLAVRIAFGRSDLPFYPTNPADLDTLPGWGADEEVFDLLTITPGNVDEPREYLFDIPADRGRYVWLRPLYTNSSAPDYEIGMSATLLLSGACIYPLDPSKYAGRVTA